MRKSIYILLILLISSIIISSTCVGGQEIKDFGFADNVIKSEKKKDKGTAKAESIIQI